MDVGGVKGRGQTVNFAVWVYYLIASARATQIWANDVSTRHRSICPKITHGHAHSHAPLSPNTTASCITSHMPIAVPGGDLQVHRMFSIFKTRLHGVRAYAPSLRELLLDLPTALGCNAEAIEPGATPESPPINAAMCTWVGVCMQDIKNQTTRFVPQTGNASCASFSHNI